MLPRDIHTRVFGNKSQLLSTYVDLDLYYLEHKDDDISGIEIDNTIKNYYKPIYSYEEERYDEEIILLQYVYIPILDAVETHSYQRIGTLTEGLISLNNNTEQYVEYVTPSHYGFNINFNKGNFMILDVAFIKELYSRRLSLMNINSNYAIEKTLELFMRCIDYLSNTNIVYELYDYQVYLYLQLQCTALGIKFTRIKTDSLIPNIKYINESMINDIYNKIK